MENHVTSLPGRDLAIHICNSHDKYSVAVRIHLYFHGYQSDGPIVITYRDKARLADSSVKILVNVEMLASVDNAMFVKSLGSWSKWLRF